MATQQIETVYSKQDLALATVACIAVLAGVLGYALLAEQPLLVRLAVMAAGVLAGLGIGWFSLPGKRFIAFAREGYDEARRVVWPTRKETINTTGVVFAFVVIMALFLFVVDKSIEWTLYDLLLNWR
jgi:preprotein translocase subunit SecE